MRCRKPAVLSEYLRRIEEPSTTRSLRRVSTNEIRSEHELSIVEIEETQLDHYLHVLEEVRSCPASKETLHIETGHDHSTIGPSRCTIRVLEAQ